MTWQLRKILFPELGLPAHPIAASRWLEQGDYERASDTLPKAGWFPHYDLQVHILAGHYDRAAGAVLSQNSGGERGC